MIIQHFLQKYYQLFKTAPAESVLDFRFQFVREYFDRRMQLPLSCPFEFSDLISELLLSNSRQAVSILHDSLSSPQDCWSFNSEFLEYLLKQVKIFPEPNKFLYKSNEYTDLRSGINCERTKTFSEVIKGRKIHLIGPSESIEKQLEACIYTKDYDQIPVLLNVNTSTNLAELEKTDSILRRFSKSVAYFNGSNAKKYFSHLSTRTSSSIAPVLPLWHCFKSSTFCFSKNFRQFPVPSLFPFQYSGGHSLNLMPLALADILSFEPSSIYISGFDLYINPSTYRDGYHDCTKDLDLRIFESFTSGGHDPISNRRFLKLLIYQNSNITCSEALEFALSISENNFLELLFDRRSFN